MCFRRGGQFARQPLSYGSTQNVIYSFKNFVNCKNGSKKVGDKMSAFNVDILAAEHT